MAADFFSVSDCDAISEVIAEMDPEIHKILSQVGRAKQDKLVDDLIRASNMKSLREIRISLFRAAMDKVDLCLSLVAKAHDESAYTLSEQEERMFNEAESLLRALIPKDMIQRKCIKKLSIDVIDLVTFISSSKRSFPVKMMRASSMIINTKNSQGDVNDTPTEVIACLQQIADSLIRADWMEDVGMNKPKSDTEKERMEGSDPDDEDRVGPQINTSYVSNDKADGSAICDGDDEMEMKNDSSSDSKEKRGCTVNEENINKVAEQDCDKEVDVVGEKITSEESDDDDEEMDVTGDLQLSDDSGDDSHSDSTEGEEFMMASEMGNQDSLPDNERDQRNAEREVIIDLCDNALKSASQTEGQVCIQQPAIELDIDIQGMTGQGNGKKDERDVICENNDGEHETSNSANTRTVQKMNTLRSSTDQCADVGGSCATKQRNGLESIQTARKLNVTNPVKNNSIKPKRVPMRIQDQRHANVNANHDPPPAPTNEVGDNHDAHDNRRQDEQLGYSKPNRLHNQQPSAHYDTPITIVVKIGEFSTRLEVPIPYTIMAGRMSRRGNDPNERKQTRRDDDEDRNEWQRRLDAQDQRIDEMEDALVEQMRKLRLQSDEVAEEVRRMRRHEAEAEDNRRVLEAPAPEAIRAARDRVSATNSSMAERLVGNPRRRGSDLGNPRTRAASFAGRTNTSGARPKEVQREPQRSHEPNDVEKTAPKPQRVRKAVVPRSRATDDGKTNDNPIRDWLHTARKDAGPAETTPDVPRRGSLAERSPSWADEVVPDDEADTSSESTPPPPTTDRRGPTRRGGDRPQMVDIYQLPPSGQVKEREARRRGQANNGNGNDAINHRRETRSRGKNQNDGDMMNNNAMKGNNNNKGKSSARGRGQKGGNGMSYAKVVTNSGWKTVATKKRKYDTVSPKPTHSLRGIAATRNRDIYLQGLALGDMDSDEDVIECVRAYCLDRDITPVFLRIIPVRFDCTRTGCRLTVRESDYDTVICEDFWPDHISVRDWTPRPRDNAGNGGEGEGPPSDHDD